MSYSCMKNIKKTINKHNFKISKEKDDSLNDRCNCRDRDRCPLNDNCLINNIRYKATIKEEDNTTKIYTLVPQKWIGKTDGMISASITEDIPTVQLYPNLYCK